jgi:hypothetical protein
MFIVFLIAKIPIGISFLLARKHNDALILTAALHVSIRPMR